MRIALTGARGFIGSHVAEYLAARGDEVATAIVRAPCDDRALAGTFAGADCVVHLAGVVSSPRENDYRLGNVEVTRAVAAAAHAAGARMVHISSLAAAGPAPPAHPCSEDDECHPINAYGRSKLESERVVAAVEGLRWTILRPGVVYGPRDRALLPLFRSARRGLLPLVGRPSAAYMFVHVSDVVQAIVAAIDGGGASETMFVAHPRPVGTRELLEEVRSTVGDNARIVRIPQAALRVIAIAGDVFGVVTGRRALVNSRRYDELMSEGFVCRVDRLRDRLGVVAATDLTDGIASTAVWYREAGWL